MLAKSVISLVLLRLAAAHGGHSGDSGAQDHAQRHALDMDGVDTRGYAERHMSQEHHIDAFDLESFFALHDLDSDKRLSVPEIEAIYGLHHPAAVKGTPDAHMESKRKVVVEKVLRDLDRDNDGFVSLEEFLAAGPDPLPSFLLYPDLGHHYDEESEYYLHHEELFHSTPDTQTDESYNHPEDIAHFSRHEHIEAQEDARERAFEGLPEDAPVGSDRVINDIHDSPSPEGGDEKPFQADDPVKESRKPARVGNEEEGKGLGAQVLEGLNKAKEAAEKLGSYGEDGFHRPRNPEEKLRKGTPYRLNAASDAVEYKFRNRNEF